MILGYLYRLCGLCRYFNILKTGGGCKGSHHFWNFTAAYDLPPAGIVFQSEKNRPTFRRFQAALI